MSGIALLITIVLVAGYILTSLSYCLKQANTGGIVSTAAQFVWVAVFTAAMAYLCWWSYQPMSGVMAPNVLRTMVVAGFIGVMALAIKRNVFPKMPSAAIG